jgi:hypothetical protein
MRTPCDAVVEEDSECQFFISFDAVNENYLHTPPPFESLIDNVFDP